MCKFESSQKDESRWQSTDSSKAYRNTSAFKCNYISLSSVRQRILPTCVVCLGIKVIFFIFMQCLSHHQKYCPPRKFVLCFVQRCNAKKRGVETAFSHQIKRKAAATSSNKVSIRLQEFPAWTFLFHCRLLTSSANLRVASTSVRSQSCFNVIVWISRLQVTLLLQKGVERRFHPTTPLVLRRSISLLLVLIH